MGTTTFMDMRAGLLLCSAAIGLAAPALAEDQAATTLEAITVTARKIEEDIKDVPFSVTAVSAEEARKKGAVDTKALARSVPGLNYGDSGLSFANMVNIRGIGSASALISPSVIYYVDGVPMQVRVFDAPFGDIARIEVLRGPQGTLFGMNAQAGAVSITTADPADVFGGSAGVEVGSNGHRQASATIEGPLSDTISARLSGTLSDSNGNLTNILWSAPGVVGSSETDLRARLFGTLSGKLLIAPDEGTRITVTGGWSRDKQNPTTGVWLDDPGFPRNSFNPLPELETETAHLGVTVEHDLEWARLTAVTGVRSYDTSMEADLIDGFIGTAQSGLPGFAFQTPGVNVRRIDERGTQLTQEVRLDGETEGGTRWISGVSGLYSTFDSTTDITSLALANGSYNGRIDTINLAAFGEVTVPLADRFNWIGGLRLTHESKDFDGLFLGRGGALPRFAEGGNDSETFLTGRTGLTYAFTEDVTGFATIAHGRKTGGYLFYNQFASLGLPLSPYDPSSTWSYEAGLKATGLGGMLDFSAAVFLNDTKDEQLFTFNPMLGRFSVQNADTRSYGLELDARAALTEEVSVFGNLALLDATITDERNALIKGKDVPYSPSAVIGFGAEYRRELAAGPYMGEGYVRADYSYTASREIDPANSRKLDGYGLVNLRAGWETETFEVYGSVENLFDTRYVSSAYQAGTTGAGQPVFAGIPGEARTFTLGARVKF
ncbi:TonB-dependent receptor [Shinella sp.]|uniref:TonB-dependent receptor n=1 Tax=Shinella sp. TaxID=1870904 RepID=UPI0039E4B960